MAIIAQLENKIKPLFDNEHSGHDYYHLVRTLNLARKIQEKEGGDRTVIIVSAFLHDFHRLMMHEKGRYVTPEESLPRIKELLEDMDLSGEQKEKILHCIKHHEEYDFSRNGKTTMDKETLIVQDADNLDAIGAIGIARLFSYGGAHKRPIWIPDLDHKEEFFDDDKPADPSQMHHMETKLLRLKDNMNTETARKIAQNRHKFMEVFIDEFFKEWEGVK